METSRTFLVILQDFRKKRQNFVDNPIFIFIYLVTSPIGKMFGRQITDLILVFRTEYKGISVKCYTMNMYGYLLTFFDNLKHLSIIGSYSHYFPPLQLSKSPLSFISSTLHKLCIRVMTYDDCLLLLDGRLKQLTTLIVDIIDMTSRSSNIYNMVSLHIINLIFSTYKKKYYYSG